MLTTRQTLAQAFRQSAEARPGQEALVCGEERLTFGQLLSASLALANGLQRLGIRKGDRIACLLPPGSAFIELFFAAAELGAVIVPLNPQLRRRALARILGEAKPALLAAEKPPEEQALQAAPGLRGVMLAQRGGLQVKGSSAPPAGILFLEEVLAAASPEFAPADEVSPQDLLALLYTSGTTGEPKGAMHSHASLIAPVVASLRLRQLWISKPGLKWLGKSARALARYRSRLLRAAGRPQTFLSTTGWHTITGLEVMLQGLLMGDRLVVMPRFHPRQALEWIEKERVTILIAIPMALQMMLALDDLERYDLASLLICATGAAPCPPELARQIQKRFGCAVHIGFGATETAGGIAATSLEDSAERQATTVGRPMPGMEIRIVDERRRELPAGQVGELACRSESLMLGYYGDERSTAEVIDEEGWYYTGDLAVVDAEGFVRIVGRKKDVIIRGGQNVYPAEIEACLAAHPGVREAAVVGIPSPRGGDEVWAFVIPQPGARLDPRQVLDHCRAELEAYKIPSQVRFVADFPRAETGKPQKFALREQALRALQEAEADDGAIQEGAPHVQ